MTENEQKVWTKKRMQNEIEQSSKSNAVIEPWEKENH